MTWQDDTRDPRCPYCQQEFTPNTFRRHYCRTCGKVVSGDPATGCSLQLGLDVASSKSLLREEFLQVDTTVADATIEKIGETIPLDVRLCKECNQTLFSKRDFDLESQTIDPSSRAYKHLHQFERCIRLLLPRFQRLLTALQDPDNPPTSA